MLRKIYAIVIASMVSGVVLAEVRFTPSSESPESITMNCGTGKLIFTKKVWSWVAIEMANGKKMSLTDPFFYQVKLKGENTVYWLSPDSWKRLDENWKKVKFSVIPEKIHGKTGATVLRISIVYKTLRKDVWISSYPDENALYVTSKSTPSVGESAELNMSRQCLHFNSNFYSKVLVDGKMLIKSSLVKKYFFLYSNSNDQSLVVLFDDGKQLDSKSERSNARVILDTKTNVQLFIYDDEYHNMEITTEKPLTRRFKIAFGDGDMSKDGRLEKCLKVLDANRFYTP